MSRARVLCATLVAALGGVLALAGSSAAAGGEVAIYGYVLDSAGAPVVDAFIRVQNPATPGRYWFTRTAADGSYLVPVTQFVTVYVQVVDDTVPHGTVTATTEELPTSSSRSESITLPGRATVRALVILGDAGPGIAGASVTATDPVATTFSSGGLRVTNRLPNPTCATSSTGSCDLAVLAGGSVSTFEVTPPTGYPRSLPGGAVAPGTTERTLVMPADHEVSGVVTTGEGDAIDGATVQVTNERTGASVSTSTGSDGHYSLRMSPDRIRLRVSGIVDGLGTPLRFVIQTGAYDLDRPREVSLSVPVRTPLVVHLRDDLDRPLPDARADMQSRLSAATGRTSDGVSVVTELQTIDGHPMSCPPTDSSGVCVFPVLVGGDSGTIEVKPLVGSTAWFPTAPAVGGTDRTAVLTLPGLATAPSAGSVPGSVHVAVADGRFDRLDVGVMAAPAGVDPLVGRVDYRVRVDYPGDVVNITMRLPNGVVPNAVLRTGADGHVTDVSSTVIVDYNSIRFHAQDGDATDADGTADGVVTGTITPVVREPLVIDDVDLPAAAKGTPYAAALTGSGPWPPVTWEVISGGLPPGLTMGVDGRISGTPAALGSFTFIVRAWDKTGASATRQLTLTVASVVVATASLPEAYLGGSYSTKLERAGGGSFATWRVVSGALPPGVTLTSGGTLSGRPTGLGTYRFGVTVTSGGDTSPPRELSFVVRPMEIATESLPAGSVGRWYSQALTTHGGKGPLTWSLVSGSLPPKLALGSGGRITGTPNTRGTWTFTVRVADSSVPKQVATATLTITVA